MQEIGSLLINFIPLYLLIILFVVVFNIWYISCKIKNQTEAAVKEFEFQVNRRMSLIGEMIAEIGKYAKSKAKSPFEEDFKNIVKKFSKVSFSEVGQSLIKEMDSVLQSITKVAQKYPDLISSAKFKSLKKELDKVDGIIKSTQEAYFKAFGVCNKWVDKFPFNIFQKSSSDIDKTDQKNKAGKEEKGETNIEEKQKKPRKKRKVVKKTIKKKEEKK